MDTPNNKRKQEVVVISDNNDDDSDDWPTEPYNGPPKEHPKIKRTRKSTGGKVKSVIQ